MPLSISKPSSRRLAFVMLGAGFLFGATFTGCAKKQTAQTGGADALTMGSWQEPDSLNPLTYQMSSANEVLGLFYRELVGMDEKWNFFPQLAVAIPNTEKGDWVVNADNTMRVDWRLKKGLKWQDGRPLTPADFVFGWKLAMHPGLPVASREREELIGDIKVTGEDTFSVFYKDIYAYADILGPRPMPAHALQKLLPRLDKNPNALADFDHQPLGNGPFMVKRWSPGQFVELVRNPHYQGEKAALAKVILRLYAENTLLPQRLMAGEIQATSPQTGFTFQQWLDMKKSPPKNLTPYAQEALTWEHIDFNLEDPVLKDVRVRRALLLATDRDRITQNLFEGELKPSHTWLPPRHSGYDQSLPPLDFDPQKAGALLKEAGFSPGTEGYLQDKNGKRLSLTIMTTTGDNVRVSVQEMLKDMWKKVGVELLIRNQPAKTLFGETLTKRKFPHLILYAWTFAPWADGQNLWACNKIPGEANGWSGQNMVALCDPALDALEKKIARTINKDERTALFAQEQKRWRELMPALPLYFRNIQGAHATGLKNFLPTGSEVPVSWNAERWGFKAR